MENQADPTESWWNEKPEREERPSQYQALSGFGVSSELQSLRQPLKPPKQQPPRARPRRKGDYVWLKAIAFASLLVAFICAIASALGRR
jgi:hypothetical protein